MLSAKFLERVFFMYINIILKNLENAFFKPAEFNI